MSVEMMGMVGVSMIFSALFFSAGRRAKAIGISGEELPRLGNLTGRSREELLESLGEPEKVEYFSGGKTLLRWYLINGRGTESIAILFDEKDRFLAMSRDGGR